MTRADRVHSTPPTNTNIDIEALREFHTSRQLQAAGLRLQRAPAGGRGFQIMAGNQVLAGRGRGDFELSLDQVIEFLRRTKIIQ
jgi:hypothetical protein